jgi:hypothetical protein
LTGAVAAVGAALLAEPSAWATLQRLRKPATAQLLGSIANGSMPLTHAAFDEINGNPSAAYFRELLVAHGVLPPRNRELANFEAWVPAKLADIEHPEHSAIVREFVVWNYLPRFRESASREVLRVGEVLAARQSIPVATEFLEWLQARGHALSELSQPDLEEWLSTPPTTRWQVHAFIVWALETSRVKRVRLPSHHFGSSMQLCQDDRLQMIQQLFYGDEIPLGARAAGLLLLLYAQPVTAIARLTTADVQTSPEVMIRLARHYVPVPKPFDEILLALLAQAGSRRSDVATWLLPGRVPGQPMSAQALRVRLKAHGLPVRAGKNGALAVLVAELPAALVAETIGIHPTTANRWASHTATGWRRYARRALDGSAGQTASSPVPGR